MIDHCAVRTSSRDGEHTMGVSSSTNVTTHFFREPAGLDLVRSEFLDMSARVKRRRRVPRIWSAGCATGEEAYSLAIVAREADADAIIVATDVNNSALQHARRGLYSARAIRDVSSARRQAWFEERGAKFEVAADLRALVTFQHHDLLGPMPCPRPPTADAPAWDVILCRNVLIYFGRKDIERVAGAMAAALAPGGLLLVGASERLPTSIVRSIGLALVRTAHGFAYRVDAPAKQGPRSRRGQEPRREEAAPREPRQRLAPSAAAANDGGSLEELRELGDRMLDLGDTERAMRLYERALCRDGLAADIHLRLGICALRRSDDAAARTALRRSLFLRPDLWPAALLLGDLMAPTDPGGAALYLEQARDSLRSGGSGPANEAAGLQAIAVNPMAALSAIERRLALLGARPRRGALR